MRRVLVIDDELAMPAAGAEFSRSYSVPGFKFDFAASLEQTRRKLQSGLPPALILLDIRFEGQGDTHGLDILAELRDRKPQLPIVMMSGRREPEILINTWDLGARSYVVKWGDNPKFKEELSEKIKQFALYQPPDIILGSSPRIRHLREMIESVAGYDTTVLIEGETGTGKELVAESLHLKGSRASGPLIKINCGAIPDTLVESELFGHIKGAFTGAWTDHKGKVEEANGGVLFLDEVGELKPEMQTALLRFLDRREFSPVGESRTRTVDVQVIAATNRPMKDAVRQGQFREDLYHRLDGFRIETPPLRECKEDIPILADHFLEIQKNRRFKAVSGFSAEVIDIFLRYRWPGNVRELANIVERAFILTATGEIMPTAIPEEFRRSIVTAPSLPPLELPEVLDIKRYLNMLSWSLIRQVYEQEAAHGMLGIKKRVAKRLGLNPVNGLGRKIQEIKGTCPELVTEIEEVLSNGRG